MKIMTLISFKGPMHAFFTKCSQLCSSPPPTHASARDSWIPTDKSVSVSCGVTAPFPWVFVHTRFCLWPPRVCFPVLCKFWWFYGEVNGDLFQEGLCYTQVYCTQIPCPSSSPLLTCTSAGDTQTQFSLSLCGVSGSWYAQVCLSPLSVSGRYGV